MRVRFCGDALDAPEAWRYLDIIVFKFFRSNRHVWDVPNPAAVQRSRWLKSEPTGRWSSANRAFLEKSVTKQAHRPQKSLAHALVLCVAMTSSLPLTLTPPDAEHVLSQPVHVVVENARSDGAFLEAAILAFDRVGLRAALTKQQWALVSAGGSGELEKRVEEVMRRVRTGPPRVLVVKDGDRLTPGDSPVTRAMKVADEYRHVHEVPVVTLRKREMENYLPMEVLEARTPRKKRDVLRAFRKLTQAQRDHYDMKHGFMLKDGRVHVHEDQRGMFHDLDDQDMRDLCGGFGERIWTLFEGAADVITRTTLRASCPDDPDEIERILDTIESLL
jgi:hypothetical protein